MLAQLDGDGVYEAIRLKAKYPLAPNDQGRIIIEYDANSPLFGDGRLAVVLESLPNSLDPTAQFDLPAGAGIHISLRGMISWPGFFESVL